jgi:hypothetical protein
MKNLFILALLLFSLPSWATWTIVQHVVNTACGATSQTCVIPVSATGSGHSRSHL